MTPLQQMAMCGADVSDRIVYKTLDDFLKAGGAWQTKPK
jgi:hypothetical protein